MNTLGTWTLFRREMKRFAAVWMQTIATPVITNLLFFLVFGVALAARGGSEDYLAALVPGLAIMGLMQNSFGNPLGSLMIAKFTNAVTELLTIPLRGFEVTIAYLSASIVRGTLIAIVTVLVGMAFTHVTFAHPLLIILYALLIGSTFASLGIVVGIVSKDFDQAGIVQNFILTPMMYLGGVFFPTTALPGVWGVIAHFNPLLYMVDGFRGAFLGQGEIAFSISLAVTFVAFAVSFSLAAWVFESGYKLRT